VDGVVTDVDTGPPQPRRRSVTRTAAAVAAVALVGVVAVGAVAVRESLGTDCRPPDVQGSTLPEARSALQAAGVAADDVGVVARRASDLPQDVVLDQAATTCTEPVDLIVSDGGPVVGAEDVPEGLVRLLGEEAEGPLRSITTARGTAYKSDALLVGDCPAVEAAVADVTDPEYATACRPDLGQRLATTVSDAVRTWGGDGDGTGAAAGPHEPVAGRLVPWYAGTWWGGRATVNGWRLQAAVTVTGGDDTGAPPAGAQRPDVEEAVLFVVRVRAGAVSDVVLLPPEGLSRTDAGPPPVDLAGVRDLADALLTEATTA
jgi:hypothetical protein